MIKSITSVAVSRMDACVSVKSGIFALLSAHEWLQLGGRTSDRRVVLQTHVPSQGKHSVNLLCLRPGQATDKQREEWVVMKNKFYTSLEYTQDTDLGGRKNQAGKS